MDFGSGNVGHWGKEHGRDVRARLCVCMSCSKCVTAKFARRDKTLNIFGPVTGILVKIIILAL
jgi:hypothetical protein